MSIELAECNTGNEKPFVKLGRPAVYVSGAARKAAYRAKSTRLDLTLKNETAATLSDLAGSLDCSQNELVTNLIRFALTNRNWKSQGLMGSRA